MFTFEGKTALITGASSGIGAQFSKALAARKANLILVARSEQTLQQLAAELSRTHGIRAEVIAADLSRPGAAQQIMAEVQRGGLHVDILINNAGFATHGLFDSLTVDRQRDEIQLNVMAAVELAHAVLPDMRKRGYGVVINVASTAAFQADPYMAVYGATKAFTLSFSEALWAEYKPYGVRVLALCPGATDTGFFNVVGAEEASVGRRDTPEHVVQVGLSALERGRSFVIPGWQNAMLALATKFLPRRQVIRM